MCSYCISKIRSTFVLPKERAACCQLFLAVFPSSILLCVLIACYLFSVSGWGICAHKF